ncbi:HAMP domain-containing protein [Pseudodesulfovibrio sp. JC047]|uniref:HAMP domain-containing sensor histidine kinase n=1 Tax=Pseudodesulfovibrio sp. JC047 TaxID=2683199 RepID=UPI0013D0279A|nr:sensor histidine kinase [Pseudodesulfovibrio sp. JC047]NDV19339.1 HAMP domain-containing protein [Pseudodesulfovibrio sp. JC047]
MKIKAQLSILFAIVILALTAFAVTFVTTSSSIGEAIADSHQAYDLTRDASTLYRISAELTKDNHIRIKRQWDIVMEKIHHDLDMQPKRVASYVSSMKTELKKVNDAFQTTIRTYRTGGTDISEKEYNTVQYYNRTQLALILNALVTKANIMAQSTYLYIEHIRTQRMVYLFAIGIVSIFFIVIWLTVFWKAIMIPLRKIYLATKIVSTGDIKKRIETTEAHDELNMLLISFNAMLDRLQQLTVSRKRLLNATEKEQARIGRELHDGITQTLIGVRLKLELLSKDMTNKAEVLPNVIQHLSQAHEEIQSIVKDLHPAILDERGLKDALRWFFNHSLHPKSTVSLKCTNETIPNTLYIPIFRIVQEASNNAQRHGNATSIDVAIQCLDDGVHISISDDGQGFILEKARLGNGIINIRERVEAEGGTVSIESDIGKGCTINARFPFPTA